MKIGPRPHSKIAEDRVWNAAGNRSIGTAGNYYLEFLAQLSKETVCTCVAAGLRCGHRERPPSRNEPSFSKVVVIECLHHLRPQVRENRRAPEYEPKSVPEDVGGGRAIAADAGPIGFADRVPARSSVGPGLAIKRSVEEAE